MKIIATTIGALFAIATMASAEDFKASMFETNFTSGNLTFSGATVQDGDTSIGMDIDFLDHQLGAFDSNLNVGFAYNVDAEDVTVGLAYETARSFNAVSVYGEIDAEYTFVNVGNDYGIVTPSAGVTFDVTENIYGYTEVGYSWEASNDWASLGGYMEVGASFDVAEGVSIVPSLTQTFDTGADALNAGLELNFAF